MIIFNRILFIVSLLCIISFAAFAQPGLLKMKGKLGLQKINTPQSFYKFDVNEKIPSQGSLLFSKDMALQSIEVKQWLTNQLQLRNGMDDLNYLQAAENYDGFQLQKLQQFFKGVKVEHGVINSTGKNDKVLLMQMEFYAISDSLQTVPVLTEKAALQKALEYTGATRYAWDQTITLDPDWLKPTGELVIVEDIFDNIGKLCLAYKFNIYALEPLSREYIYINAITGRIVFKDAIIKHANGTGPAYQKDKSNTGIKEDGFKRFTQEKSRQDNNRVKKEEYKTLANATGTAATLYSGTRTIITDKVAADSYELHETGRGSNTSIETRNLGQQIDFSLLSEIVDDDNNWTAAEYDPADTRGALDVHWGAEQVVDYWWTVHGRKSYDNADGTVLNFIRYKTNYNNAFWNGKAMFYGDGSGAPNGQKTFVSLDICGHELGHAVCQKTAGLVYQRESGALNEGFSDIWAACIDNYVTPVIIPQIKNPWLFGDEIEARTGHIALRSMANPLLENQPDTYLDFAHFWKDATLEGCPVPHVTNNDYCGVHFNSGVLNKWFYLITMGGSATNGNNYAYNVTAMGFTKTEKLAYFTEQILTPNSGFEAAKVASVNAASILGWTADIPNILEAWKAVGVFADTLYNIANTPVFSSNQFTSIAVGKRGYVWAGTANNGLYRYNGKEWQKAPGLLNHNIADIKTDANGGIWIAQFGRTGAQALNGGVDYFPDTSFSFTQYGTPEGLSTRNVRSLFINNSLAGTELFKKIWVAAYSDLTGSVIRPGSVIRGLGTPIVAPNYFKKIVKGVDQNNGFCAPIGGNESQVWVFATSNFGRNQILRYNTADTSFIGFFDETNSILPQGFFTKAIYYDKVYKLWWVGMLQGGVYIYNTISSTWTQVNFPSIFPAGTIINNNAITGDDRGNVYIGTTNGYVFYGNVNAQVALKTDSLGLYKRFTKADGLPADNIRAVCLDTRANRVIMATDSGIVFKYILCPSCIGAGPIFSMFPGPWSSSAVWSNGDVPGINTNVVITHAVTVTQDANCNSLKIISPGSVTVSPGVKLNVEGVDVDMSSFNKAIKNN